MDEKLIQRQRTVCMIGTLIPENWFNCIQKSSKGKAAGSPVFMQKQIYQSLCQEGETVSVYSYPPVAAYPAGAIIGTRRKQIKIESGLSVTVIPMINILGLKQITVFFSMFYSILRWSIANKGKYKVVLTYADFLEYCLPAIIVSKLFHNKTVLYLTELPGYEHYHTGKIRLKDRLIFVTEKLKIKGYQFFDGYIFVSRALAEIVNPGNAPWTVVESFADQSLFDGVSQEKERNRTIMYAGSLGEAYNICMLIDAFHSMKGDYELWLYGDGKYAEYAKQMAQLDSRIMYFGVVDRKQVLKAEKRAHLLVHAKTSDDPHSKYSFSSKIMEYMASGTPVLTTKVEGIPDEYYQYAYCVDQASVESMAKAMLQILSLPLSELEEKGEKARDFIYHKKNMKIQAHKIIQVLQHLQD